MHVLHTILATVNYGITVTGDDAVKGTFTTFLSNANTIIITFAVPLLTFLGVQKFIIEPRYEARISRRKYATALYLACKELSNHLDHIFKRLNSPDSGIGDAMLKIPNNDFKGKPDWFVKEGYFTTITAYKIAAVSAWLRAYQNELLFSSYPENQSFLKDLYISAQNLKIAFSTDTCFWYYYFDAIGEKLIEKRERGEAVFTFAAFCDHYTNDTSFRLFFEQVHMYIWFLGKKRPNYLKTVPDIQNHLQLLINHLENKNFLPGFRVERPYTAVDELKKAKEAGWDWQ